MKKTDCVSVGNCGEYFVAAELERHGYTAAIPMSDTKDFDILAKKREKPFTQVAIQVKTTQHSHRKWMLNKKCEKIIGKDIKYVLVSLNEKGSPEYYVVPSEYIAKTITANHKKWLNTPGKNGHKHNDNSIRWFWIDEEECEKYYNKWENLEK